MKNIITLFVLSLAIISCGNDADKSSTEKKSVDKVTPAQEDVEIGWSSYAVIWKWTTADEKLVSDNTVKISEELTFLWKKGIVENVYFDGEAKEDKLSNFPNISFFMKANSKQEAEKALDKLTIVKKGIASYSVHPVGTLWLNRKYDAVKDKGFTKSYVAVWETKSKPSDELTAKQHDTVLALWEEGKIENAYFDIEGTQVKNEDADFVFFANANSEEEAKKLCESLPFYAEGIATYEIFPAGTFWLGQYSDK